MSYYDEVYTKRLNATGKTRQERIQHRKTKEFKDLFLHQSQYQAKIYQINDKESDIVVALERNKWNENQIISNLLVPLDEKRLHTGDILRVFQKIDDVEYDKIWLIYFIEDNIGKGYQNYKAICLDSEIEIANEYGDTQFIVPVKFVNASSAFVVDHFSLGGDTKGYREPAGKRNIITRNFDFLKKEVYFNYADRGWEIAGKDDISIENVAYVSLAERLIREPEPRTSEEILVGDNTNFFLNGR